MGAVLNLPIKQTYKFMPRQQFWISPEGWSHRHNHTQAGCGQLEKLLITS